jgi:Uma2 family endonuclease
MRVRWYFESQQVTVPDWVVDLESFRRWADADDFPDEARISWLCGEVEIDMSREQLFTHGQVKTRMTVVLGGLSEELGYWWVDGPRLSNEKANISVNPDGIFVSKDSLESETVHLRESMQDEGYVEILGSPDMVLEVLSASSVRKDTVVLHEGYWKAGVKEYWLVDARAEPVKFDIFRHTEQGYVATRRQRGWLRSQVFDKSFRITRTLDSLNKPVFTLEVR